MFRESMYLDQAATEFNVYLEKTGLTPSFIKVLQCTLTSTVTQPSGNRVVTAHVVIDVDSEKLDDYIYNIKQEC